VDFLTLSANNTETGGNGGSCLRRERERGERWSIKEIMEQRASPLLLYLSVHVMRNKITFPVMALNDILFRKEENLTYETWLFEPSFYLSTLIDLILSV